MGREGQYQVLLQKNIRGQSSPGETEWVLDGLQTSRGIDDLGEKSLRVPITLSKLCNLLKKRQIAAGLAGFVRLAATVYPTDFTQREVIILPDHSTVTMDGDSDTIPARSALREKPNMEPER